MIKFFRLLITGPLSLALALMMVSLLQAPAEAATVHHYRLGPTTSKFIDFAAKARVSAYSKTGGTMDYRKLTSVFNSAGRYSVEWRRMMAAGSRQAGTKIINISSAESLAVDRVRATAWPCTFCAPSRDSSANVSAQRYPPSQTCGTGESKQIDYSPLKDGKWKFDHYYNSCQTNIIIANYNKCALFVGIVAGATAVGNVYAGLFVGLFSAMCAANQIDLSTAQANSDVHAIIERTGFRSNLKGGTAIDAVWLPQ